ncbi:flavin reductase family protein, partial [uncultured Muribaculum sp.]
GLTPVKGQKVSSPYIDESPVNIECRVRQIISLGSHDMFIAEVVNVLADQSLINPETGAFNMQKAGLIAYSHGAYYSLGEQIGRFGWSVKKK